MSAMEHRVYTMIVHDEGDGMLWGEIEDLPGCFASGRTSDELLEAMTEAIRLYESDAPAGAIPIHRGRRRKAAKQQAAAAAKGRMVSANICMEA